MKFNKKLFFKTFLLAFLTFGVLSVIIITSLYIDANAIDPLNEETTVLVGVTEKDILLSLCIINFDPENNTISYLPIPDNVWIDNSVVLQDQYNKRSISNLKNSLETLIGTKINRYILFSTDNLAALNNHMGQFPMNVQYQFEHNGEMKAGTLHMDGELVKSMFTYSKYDMTKVSMSDIGFAYLKTFLATFAKPSHIVKLSDIASDKSFIRDTNTNLSKKEILSYCQLLSQYTLIYQRTIELSGKYDTQPYSSTYFIPDTPQANKNIFK